MAELTSRDKAVLSELAHVGMAESPWNWSPTWNPDWTREAAEAALRKLDGVDTPEDAMLYLEGYSEKDG